MTSRNPEPDLTFDLILRGGTIYDGSGGEPFVADIGVRGDAVARIGGLDGARATTPATAHAQLVGAWNHTTEAGHTPERAAARCPRNDCQ